MIYLDHAATTPLLPEVQAAMRPWLAGASEDVGYANPNALYRAGREARQAIECARVQLAAALSARPDQIIFTGSGTEADNQAIFSAAQSGADRLRQVDSKPKLIVSAFEHHAVLNPARALRRFGFQVVELKPDRQGIVQPAVLDEAIDDATVLVAVMCVQNELGTLQPVAELARIAHQYGALFLSDAIQALGKVPLDLPALGVDFAAFSAHKLGGPKGVGALYVKDRRSLSPLIYGGGQESGMRSGTQNVAGIVGFGAAAEIGAQAARDPGQRQHLAGLAERIAASATLATRSNLPDIVPLLLDHTSSETALLRLDEAGIAVSGGAACSAASLEPSHVLKAVGLDDDQAYRYLRVSLGPENTEAEVDALLSAIRDL
ncbi:MAG: cysteine desulfurase [Coriobacteriales bacterium]|jgi:cysteine desulfurase|nr:cysteine desulfurase [Coriobacteriales bacterium]